VTLAAVAALWRPQSAWLVELVYFWALTASLQAVLTPDLGHGFPDPLFFTYFATHSGAVAAAVGLLLFLALAACARLIAPRSTSGTGTHDAA
jgi:uncharacterized membrane protein YwaF